MMDQVLFLFGLYLFGLYFGLLFKRQLPLALIGASGFLWGALFWVMGGVVLSIAPLPYSPVSVLILFLILGIGLGILHLRDKTWHLTRPELTGLLPFAIGFLLVLLLANQYNFSYVSSDSIEQLITARRIAAEGLSRGVIEALSLRGVYLSQLQSASAFLGADYLAAAQPAFAFTFALVFFTLSWKVISHLLSNQRLLLALTVLTSLALFSTYFILFQAFYIHNSLISAVYLFTGVSCFWLAVREGEDSWMVLGMLALLGFSLARTEAPIFALIFLLLLLSTDRIPYRTRLISVLPALFFIASWYVFLLTQMGTGTKILNPEKTLVIIAALVACGILVLLSELKWVKRFLLPYLPQIMLGILLLVLLVMAFYKPEHIKGSLYVSLLNTLRYGRWGLTWLVFSQLLLLVSILGPRLPGERFFFFGIPTFLCLLLAMVYFRNPYRIGWYDSANRMLTHILPIVVLYVLMKAAQGHSGSALPGTRDEKKGSSQLHSFPSGHPDHHIDESGE